MGLGDLSGYFAQKAANSIYVMWNEAMSVEPLTDVGRGSIVF